MSISGQFRPVDAPPPAGEAPAGEALPVTLLLRQGLALVEELTVKLQRLDGLMMTGKPNEISEAAASVEAALNNAAPSFSEIAQAMGQLGASNLAAAAAQLRHLEQADAAGLAEALRGALTRFAKRSVNASRRAQQLNRGLSAALRSLQALGVQEAGRLIAEA
ncbi:MAG TPA: hypothetical protein VMH92_11995 [Acidocella sp.]|nr:hypothetical protein [Acidocella sp.]